MNNFRGGFGGGFGGGNLQALMKQAQKMQEDMAVARQKINETVFNGNAGGGMVSVEMTGDKKVKSVKLKEQVVDPSDVEMLEDLIAVAVNDALTQIEKMEKELLPNVPGMWEWESTKKQLKN